MTLNEFFSIHPKAALGFSGGVDSAYLRYAAVRNGAQVQPYFVQTERRPASRRRAEGPPDCAGIRYFISSPGVVQSF